MFKRLLELLKPNKPRQPILQQCSVSGSYLSILMETEKETKKETNRLLQKEEDLKIDFGISNEAKRLFIEWTNAPIVSLFGKEYKNWVMIIKPFIYCYTIYNEDSAKYKSIDISKLVIAEFESLQNCR